MIPKEETDRMKLLLAGEMLSGMMVLIDGAESIKENKQVIS